MNCPYCKNEMAPGYIPNGGQRPIPVFLYGCGGGSPLKEYLFAMEGKRV